MSGLTWLHLSDWHQKGEEFDRGVIRDALMRDLHKRTEINPDIEEIDFIIFSGDITYNGRYQEYESAVKHFFLPLFEATGLGSEGWKRLIIVPGNHDVDREKVKETLRKFDLNIKDRLEANETLETEWKRKAILSSFADYNRFISEHFQEISKELGDDPSYFCVRHFEAIGKRIAVLALNSALLSGVSKDAHGEVSDYGNLIMGEPQVRNALQGLDNADVRIAVMHHPFSWLNEFDRSVVEGLLSRYCHFILHGHEHMPRVNVVRSTIGDVVIIPAGASYNRRYDPDPRYVNAYNFVHLDFDANKGDVYLRRWDDIQDSWVRDSAIEDGRYAFTLPMGNTKGVDILTSYIANSSDISPTHKEALGGLISRYSQPLNERFFEFVDLRMKQTLEVHSDIHLTRLDVAYKIEVSPGQEDIFGIVISGGKRVSELVKSGKIKTKLIRSTFKINGKTIDPSKDTGDLIEYHPSFGKEEVTIDFRYSLFTMPEDVFELRLRRFTKHIRFAFQEAPELDYQFSPLGGFPEPIFRKREPLEIAELETNRLCHPDNGYLIQWFRPFEG